MDQQQLAAEAKQVSDRRVAAAVLLLEREWRGMGDDLDASWARVGPRLVHILENAQLGAARDSLNYTLESLALQKLDASGLGEVDPQGFVTSWPLDGGETGDLSDLLYGSVVRARTVQADSLTQRLSAGGSWLETVAMSQLADTRRQAAGVTIAATDRAGWVRVADVPCCQRCAVLNGRFYRYSSGFKRHPRCQCSMEPATQSNYQHVAPPIGPEDVKDLTVAQRQAIADGGDLNQIVNAYRGRSVRSLATTEGTTKRGTARSAMKAAGTRGPRLTPEAIYKIARSRVEAVDLLKAYGYLL